MSALHPPTPEDLAIRAYLTRKIQELHDKAPGYITIIAEATLSDHRDPHAQVSVSFRAYCEHTNHSDYFSSVDGAIAQIAHRSGGKSESQMLKEKAHVLLAEAERLQLEGK